MTSNVIGVLLEDKALSLEELARACAVEPDWVVQRVQTGVLLHHGPPPGQLTGWRLPAWTWCARAACAKLNRCSMRMPTWRRWRWICPRKWRACGAACMCWVQTK